MLYCPKCGGPTKVWDTREVPGIPAQLRRRRCRECKYVFKTLEVLEDANDTAAETPR